MQILCIISVSYTHLDVYKRQELYCEPKEQQSILGNIYAARVERVAEGIHGAFLAVSYTHLDVYKRQGIYDGNFTD